MCCQEKQRRQIVIPLHARRTDALRPDRMSQAIGIAALCGQEAGVSRYNATAGREPRGPHFSYELPEEVRTNYSYIAATDRELRAAT